MSQKVPGPLERLGALLALELALGAAVIDRQVLLHLPLLGKNKKSIDTPKLVFWAVAVAERLESRPACLKIGGCGFQSCHVHGFFFFFPSCLSFIKVK